jgi:two-component system, LytTR family, response regulator
MNTIDLPINAMLIDDEPAARASLALELRLHCPHIRIVGEAGSVAEAVALLRAAPHPDLLFLDIQLSDGSGFDVLHQVDCQNFKIIFTTAYSDYALRAIKFLPLDYLLKPIDAEELKAAVEKAVRSRQPEFGDRLQRMVQQMRADQKPVRIALKDANNIFFIKTDEIAYCEADGVYTKFFLEKGRTIVVSKNLKEYENLLEPLGFIRTHNSFLVNPEKIVRYDKNAGGSLILEEDRSVPLAFRKKDAVLKALEQRS